MSGPLDPLSDRGERMLDSLATYEQADPAVVGLMRAGADELDAIADMMETVRLHAWPHLADDTYGFLSVHEQMLGLPVNSGAAVPTRQAAAKAAVQSRLSMAKSKWIERMNTAMRGNVWTYDEATPGPNQLTITIPFQSGSWDAAQVGAIARKITPAKVEIVMRYDAGFLVGISRVGVDAI